MIQHYMSNKTIVIFDWDNTCLPTTYLKSNNYTLCDDNKLSEQDRQMMIILELHLRILFSTILTFENVHIYIITNAENQWVELSALKYMPAFCNYFPYVTVISANKLYSATYENPADWKKMAFIDTVNKYKDEKFVLVSIGDH